MKTGLSTLQRRIDTASSVVKEEKKQVEEGQVLDLITTSLCRSIAAFDAGEQEPEDHYTPDRQSAIHRFSRRYHAASAKEQLLAEFTAQITREETER